MNIDNIISKVLDKLSHMSIEKVSLCAYSSDVVSGDVFIANAGGVPHIGEAFDQGASLCICSESLPADFSADNKQQYADRLLFVNDFDAVVQKLLEIAYGDYINAVTLVGVTGTNGKTSVANFICDLLSSMGRRAGYIGTLGSGVFGEGFHKGRNTTPDNITLKRMIAELVQQGCEVIVMEVSSHGIVLDRIQGLNFYIGVFTNLHRDHLDFHGSMDVYRDVKKSFFLQGGPQISVINADDEIGQQLLHELADKTSRSVFSYGENFQSDTGHYLSCKNNGQTDGGAQQLEMRDGDARGVAEFSVAGDFQRENMAAAVSACLALEYRLDDLVKVIPAVQPVPGRMQCIRGENWPTVCIDYAHTPDGMKKVLPEHDASSSWCVFGCGGDRDEGKRTQMAAVAKQRATHIVVCDDNPRSESPEKILADILHGIEDKQGIVICRDRNKAIQYALQAAKPEDTIYLLGKGDETFSDYGSFRLPANDAGVVKQCVSA